MSVCIQLFFIIFMFLKIYFFFRESDVAVVCYRVGIGSEGRPVRRGVEVRRFEERSNKKEEGGGLEAKGDEVRRWVEEVWGNVDIPLVLCGCASDNFQPQVIRRKR